MHALRLLIPLLLFVLFADEAAAQLRLSAQLRPRAEFRRGYRSLAPEQSTRPAFFVSQRSRLNMQYKHDFVDLYGQFQDIRIWGDEGQLQDVSSMALHQFWGKIHFSDQLHLKVGRQELVYDDHRLLGNVGWVQQARSHDAAVAQFRKNGWKVDAGGAFNQTSESLFDTEYSLNNYKALSFLWAGKSFGENTRGSVIGVGDGFEALDSADNATYFRYTYGLNVHHTPSPWGLHGTFYHQSGKDRSGTAKNAWMAAARASYDFGTAGIILGVDYISGNDPNKKTDVNNTFHTLYATNHKFYGLMDYFLNVPGDTRNGGLQDIYAKASYNVSDKVKAQLHYHHFSLANAVPDPSAPGELTSKYLGGELDAVIAHKINAFSTLKAGYSVMLPDKNMENLTGGNSNAYAHWGWVMLDIKPVLFESDD